MKRSVMLSCLCMLSCLPKTQIKPPTATTTTNVKVYDFTCHSILTTSSSYTVCDADKTSVQPKDTCDNTNAIGSTYGNPIFQCKREIFP